MPCGSITDSVTVIVFRNDPHLRKLLRSRGKFALSGEFPGCRSFRGITSGSAIFDSENTAIGKYFLHRCPIGPTHSGLQDAQKDSKQEQEC